MFLKLKLWNNIALLIYKEYSITLYKKFKIQKVTKLGEVLLKASNAALHQLSFIVISLLTYGVKHLGKPSEKNTADFEEIDLIRETTYPPSQCRTY